MDASGILQPDPPFWATTSWIQVGYGIWVNMITLGIGLALGFPAVSIPQLQDENSDIVMSIKEEAWIASVLTLFAPIGSLMCGIIMDRYGRKIVLVLCEIPFIVGWFYVGFAKSANDIIIGRIITGLGIGMALIAPRAYISEVTLANMRGVIGAFAGVATSIGISLQAGLGAFLTWKQLCFISGFYSTFLMFLNLLLPETPYFMLLKTSASKTRETLQKFRSTRFNIQAEIEELKEFKHVNSIRRLSPLDQAKAVFKPASCKPFGISVAYVVVMQLSGVNIITIWAVQMFKMAHSSVEPNLCNLLLGVTRLVFSVVISMLLFRVGRRVMALTSAVGVGVMMVVLGAYLHSHSNPSVYPLLFFMSVIMFATLGYYILPILMMFEMLPLQVRGVLSGVVIATLNLAMFGTNQTYPFVRDSLGLANTLIVYGSISLVGAAFLYTVLPETKGLTLQEIEEYFNKRRPTLVSQRQVMSLQMQEASKPNMNKSLLKFKSPQASYSKAEDGKHSNKGENNDKWKLKEKVEEKVKIRLKEKQENKSKQENDKATENKRKDKDKKDSKHKNDTNSANPTKESHLALKDRDVS